MDPREPEDRPRDAEGSRKAGALGADRFPHLASLEAGWAVPGVTGLGAGRVSEGGVDGDEVNGSDVA